MVSYNVIVRRLSKNRFYSCVKICVNACENLTSMANSEQELQAGAISRAVAGAVCCVLSQRSVTPTAAMANTEPEADQMCI